MDFFDTFYDQQQPMTKLEEDTDAMTVSLPMIIPSDVIQTVMPLNIGDTPTLDTLEKTNGLSFTRKRGRGRPPGSTNKMPRIITDGKRGPGRPPGSKNKMKEMAISFASLYVPYPSECMNSQQHVLVDTPDILSNAIEKFKMVQEGKFKFGQAVVMPSFRFNDPTFKIRTTVSNLILMNILCSHHVMDTSKGIVAVFPVTVYTEKSMTKGGYPCLAIHVPLIKEICWRVYPGLQHLVTIQSIQNNMDPVACPYASSDGDVLTTLSGTETSPTSPFLILSAKWFDVMKTFFVNKNFVRTDLGVLFRRAFPTKKDKFDDSMREFWLGMERDVNVANILCLKTPLRDHVPSMTRCRALSSLVHVKTKSGPLWVIPKLSKITDETDAIYTNLSFAFGVQCWKEQLAILHSAFVYFTSDHLSTTKTTSTICHLNGLMDANDHQQVLCRTDCIKNGIWDDSDDIQSDSVTFSEIRKARAKYEHAETLATNYFFVNK